MCKIGLYLIWLNTFWDSPLNLLISIPGNMLINPEFDELSAILSGPNSAYRAKLAVRAGEAIGYLRS